MFLFRSKLNVEACLEFYTNNCPDQLDGLAEVRDTVLASIVDLSCTDPSITATFDANACPPPIVDECLVSDAIQLAVDFVIDNRDNANNASVCQYVYKMC